MIKILRRMLGEAQAPAPQAPVPTPQIGRFYSYIKSRGFNPVHILDIGANHGEWTRYTLEYFPHAQYTLVEPQDHLKSNITDLQAAGSKLRWVHAGAGDVDDIVPFTIARRDDSSSFNLSKEEAEAAGFEQVPTRIVTVNTLVKEFDLPVPDLIKIDAEGFDLKVFAGASGMHGRTEIFLIEVAFCGDGMENSLLNVARRMDEAGYVPLDLTDVIRTHKDGLIWLCDFAFVRKDSALRHGITFE